MKLFRSPTILLTCFAVLCAAECVAGDHDGPFRIGVIQGLSGIAAEDGQTVVRALRLAEETINQQEAGAVQLIVEDDMTNPRNTISAFHKLVNQDVDGIIGATWSFTTNAIIPLARNKGIPLINTSTLPEALNYEQGGGYAFNNAISIEEEAKPFLNFNRKHKLRRIAILSTHSPWGEVQVQRYQKLATQHGIRVVHRIETTTHQENDWKSLLPKVEASNPDALVLLLNRNEIELVLRRLHEQGISLPVYGSKNTYDAFHRTPHRAHYERACFTYPLQQLQKNRDFRSRFLARYHESPRIYADSSYDALFILYRALRQARTSGQDIRDILRNEHFQGLAGDYHFSKSRSLSAGRSSLVCSPGGVLQVEAPAGTALVQRSK